MNAKRIILFFLGLLLIGTSYGLWSFYKPHQNISKAKVEHSFVSSDLIQKFMDDSESINALITDKGNRC